jgi:hypothetical protein
VIEADQVIELIEPHVAELIKRRGRSASLASSLIREGPSLATAQADSSMGRHHQ